MLLRLDFASGVPIYQQIRNQVVSAIASGQLAPGEKLPTIRALAEETGINMMTASKAYQLLKSEERGPGPETIDGLRLRICELRLAGLGKDEILALCGKLFDEEVEGI